MANQMSLLLNFLTIVEPNWEFHQMFTIDQEMITSTTHLLLISVAAMLVISLLFLKLALEFSSIMDRMILLSILLEF